VKKLGVDVENLIMSKPNSNEALEIADNLLRSGQLM
jgi:RecA/RadA recombinase